MRYFNFTFLKKRQFWFIAVIIGTGLCYILNKCWLFLYTTIIPLYEKHPILFTRLSQEYPSDCKKAFGKLPPIIGRCDALTLLA
jgi:hypothetical protein